MDNFDAIDFLQMRKGLNQGGFYLNTPSQVDSVLNTKKDLLPEKKGVLPSSNEENLKKLETSDGSTKDLHREDNIKKSNADNTLNSVDNKKPKVKMGKPLIKK